MKWFNDCRFRMMFVGFVAALVLCGGTTKADFTFGEPINLGPLINSSAHEYSHCLSSDGLELYFGSRREGSLGSFDLWVATRTTTEDAWGEPKNLGQLINSPYADHGPTLSSDGLELYFNSSRPGGIGSWDIWVTRRTARDDSWGQPKNLGTPVNSSYVEYNPSLSPDSLELYFAFGSEVGLWEPKIAVTRRETVDAPWGNPVILDQGVNSWTWQDTPWISSDGLILMFTDYGWDNASPRPGGLGGTDIWLTRRSSKIAEWTIPLNIGGPINSVFSEDFPMISADGSMIYFNSDRPGGFGSQDLWQAPILPVVDFDDDGSVGMSDLLAMIAAWDTNERLCDIGPTPWGDGVVDEADLEVLMGYWGHEYQVGVETVGTDIVVDDFENYNDNLDTSTTVFQTWLDGFGAPGYAGNGTGSVVGHASGPPFAEQTIIHGGFQSMPLWYDNDGVIFEDTELEKKGLTFYSEAQRHWETPQDWAQESVEVLTLWVHGDPANASGRQIPEPLYVALEDAAGNSAVIVNPDPSTITTESWQEWSIDLAEFVGVDLTAITMMAIGVGDPATTTPGGSGVVYIDDIELRRRVGQ